MFIEQQIADLTRRVEYLESLRLVPSLPTTADIRTRVEALVAAVSKSTAVPVDDLVSHSRYVQLVRIRWVIIHAATYGISVTRSALGLVLNRDHTSICCSLKRCKDEMSIDPKFRVQVEKWTEYARHL